MANNCSSSTTDSVLSTTATDVQRPELGTVPIHQQGRLSDHANMDVLKMEEAIERSLSQAMTGLCDHFSQQVSKGKVQKEQPQRTDERLELTVPVLQADVPGCKGLQQAALQQQQQQQQQQEMANNSLDC
mmetsp:Transcript_73358/g.141906  ORF Transcript_73358/g.141906 Transcript_73358/m.141906 type:complete len:130 (-) Transcript_73358:1711-2100(-)